MLSEPRVDANFRPLRFAGSISVCIQTLYANRSAAYTGESPGEIVRLLLVKNTGGEECRRRKREIEIEERSDSGIFKRRFSESIVYWAHVA
jgi:hypothetical protein